MIIKDIWIQEVIIQQDLEDLDRDRSCSLSCVTRGICQAQDVQEIVYEFR